MRLFLSYQFDDEDFVKRVYFYLRKQPALNSFFWSEQGGAGAVSKQLPKQLRGSGLVAFIGKKAGKTQLKEIKFHSQLAGKLPHLSIELSHSIPDSLRFETTDFTPIMALTHDEAGALKCAREIASKLHVTWIQDDGLPIGYPFAYEKDIIEEYARHAGAASRDRMAEGCPPCWPPVQKAEARLQNQAEPQEIGAFRKAESNIMVDARISNYEHMRYLTLPEAGPREHLRYPLPNQDDLRVGILVSGGIAPGINAVIDGIVSRHHLYQKVAQKTHHYKLQICGYTEGFKALLLHGVNFRYLHAEEVQRAAELGGSILGTSRADELLDKDPRQRAKNLQTVVDRLCEHEGVHILYIIGGDGSMRAAHAIWTIANQNKYDLSVVAIPKTMDNDILWVWQSFGFLSAVEKAREAILNLYTEVTSNPRLGIIQLFGSDSGFVVSHAAYSAVCDLVLIPEDPLSMQQIFVRLKERLMHRYRRSAEAQSSPYGLVVMAETAIPLDAKKYLHDTDVDLSRDERNAVDTFVKEGRRVRGQTPDELRTAGLKIVSKVLQRDIRSKLDPKPYWEKFRVFTNEPRHLIRSIRPSVTDVIFGERLGTLAVDNAMAGYTDFMVSQWLTEFVLVPLRLVILGRKRVPTKGSIFWKSVLSKTGQHSGDSESDE
jgi:6-phosphofructokinase 1